MMCNSATSHLCNKCNIATYRNNRGLTSFKENRNILFCNRYYIVSFHAIVRIIGYVWSKLKCRNSVTDCNNSNLWVRSGA